jgi:hypothetical protein
LIAAAALEIEQGEGGDWGQDLLREIRARAAE